MKDLFRSKCIKIFTEGMIICKILSQRTSCHDYRGTSENLSSIPAIIGGPFTRDFSIAVK
jgi:hypothetical protein